MIAFSRRPGRATFALALALTAVLLAGCGGSSTVKPAVYVKTMCTTLGNWRNTIQGAGVALQSSGAATAPRPAAKQDYQRFVASLVTATRRAAKGLKGAGAPAVPRGRQIADRLANAFDGAARRLAQASAQAAKIRTDSASTFQLGASSVTTQIRSALQGIAAVAPGQSPALRTAAAKEPACQVLHG